MAGWRGRGGDVCACVYVGVCVCVCVCVQLGPTQRIVSNEAEDVQSSSATLHTQSTAYTTG